MKNLKAFLAGFILFVYDEYVYEDMDIYKERAKHIMRPFLFYRALVIWIFSPIFLPEYLFKQSEIYKEIQKIQNSPEYQAQMMKMMSMFKF